MALGVVPGPRFPDAADELAPNLRNQTARYRVVSFDVTLTGLTMRWEQAIVYLVGALMFIGAAASVFQLYGAAHCRWLDSDGAVARRRPARAQGAVPRLETARGGPVSDFTFSCPLRFRSLPAYAGHGTFRKAGYIKFKRVVGAGGVYFAQTVLRETCNVEDSGSSLRFDHRGDSFHEHSGCAIRRRRARGRFQRRARRRFQRCAMGGA